MSSTDLHVEEITTVVDHSLDTASSELFVVNPARKTIREFVTTLSSTSNTPNVKLFADGQTLKDVLDDFLVASRLADLVTEGRLAVRTLDTVPRSSLLLTEKTLLTIVEGGEDIAALSSTDEQFVTSMYEEYSRRWERSTQFSLRTPPLSRVRETMLREIGESAVGDFDASLDTLETACGDGDGLDEVTIALLVAANNRVLLYDISRWGEDVRLASKATFSRTKNHLESEGLIDTEKVPIEMGRPRLRLVLGENDLVEAGMPTVIERAEQQLS